jgi:predicted nucleotidyltransferase
MNISAGLDLKPEELRQVTEILKQYIPEKQVCAFGSRANGTAKSYSDLDLAVMTKQPLSLLQEALLTEAFEESDLPFRVDIIDWATINEPFKKVIQSSLINI